MFESSLNFDEAFPRYGTRHGVLPRADPAIAVSSPVMWAEALEVMMARVAQSVPGLRRLAAIAGSAQQHGSVYLNRDAGARLESLNPAKTMASQVPAMLARPVSPIWMDSSTTVECREIAQAVGGDDALAAHTGSRAFERFTGPQIRKLFKQERQAYLSTGRIHLVSSFLASLLVGRHAPLDPGDASGMNLMDLESRAWWAPALEATAPDLARTAAGNCAVLDRPWSARAVLAVALWSARSACRGLVGRQPVQSRSAPGSCARDGWRSRSAPATRSLA